MKKTKKQIEAENEWLWYNHVNIEDDAQTVITKQFNKKGEVIAISNSYLPPKAHRVQPPEHLIRKK